MKRMKVKAIGNAVLTDKEGAMLSDALANYQIVLEGKILDSGKKGELAPIIDNVHTLDTLHSAMSKMAPPKEVVD